MNLESIWWNSFRLKITKPPYFFFLKFAMVSFTSWMLYHLSGKIIIIAAWWGPYEIFIKHPYLLLLCFILADAWAGLMPVIFLDNQISSGRGWRNKQTPESFVLKYFRQFFDFFSISFICLWLYQCNGVCRSKLYFLEIEFKVHKMTVQLSGLWWL